MVIFKKKLVLDNCVGFHSWRIGFKKKKLVVISLLLLQLFSAFYLPIYLSICIEGVFCGFADFLYPLTVSLFFNYVLQCFLLSLSSSVVVIFVVVVVVVACSFGN